MTEKETAYLFDAESAVEMARLMVQDRILTKVMGGPLSGVPDLPMQAKILDLACGPGGWVLDTAYASPDSEVAGVDISRTMIDYANARALTQGLTNASFGVMDITRPLEFADASFDLVNARLLFGVVRREGWEPLLTECHRIVKSGGLLRLTEPVDFGVTTSQAYHRHTQLLFQAFQKVGYGFSPDGNTPGLTNVLPLLLRKKGYQVHYFASALEFSRDCEAWPEMYRNVQAGSLETPRLCVKAGVATREELDRLYTACLREMAAPDFGAMWHFVTVLGTKP